MGSKIRGFARGTAFEAIHDTRPKWGRPKNNNTVFIQRLLK